MHRGFQRTSFVCGQSNYWHRSCSYVMQKGDICNKTERLGKTRPCTALIALTREQCELPALSCVNFM